MKRNLYIFLLRSIIKKDFFILENSFINKSNLFKLNLFSKKILKQRALDVFLLHFELVRFIRLCYIFSKIDSFKFIVKFHELFSTTFLKSYLIHSGINFILFFNNTRLFRNFQLTSNCALISSSVKTQVSYFIKPKFFFCSESKLVEAQRDYFIRNTLKTSKKLLFLISLLELSFNLKSVGDSFYRKSNIGSGSRFTQKYKTKKKYNVRFL